LLLFSSDPQIPSLFLVVVFPLGASFSSSRRFLSYRMINPIDAGSVTRKLLVRTNEHGSAIYNIYRFKIRDSLRDAIATDEEKKKTRRRKIDEKKT